MPGAPAAPGPARPFDPGSAAFSVIHFDGRAWHALAACPEIAPEPGRLAPRLMRVDGGLHLLAAVAPSRVVHYRLEESGAWSLVDTLELPELRGFWCTQVGGVEVLAFASADGADREQLGLLRRSPGATRFWAPTRAFVAPCPADEGIREIRGATRFNQELMLLVESTRARQLLLPASMVAAPTAGAADVAVILAKPQADANVAALWQQVTLLIMGALLVGFILRRTVIGRAAVLPAGMETAPVMQRFGAGAIDFAVIAVPLSLLLRVDPWDALAHLGAWGMSADETLRLPPRGPLLWWGASVACYCVYSATAELLLRRTLGKWLLGLSVLSDAGTPPAKWQVLLRNLLRGLELLPQFWLLMGLIVISRNRQRLGDVFAMTIVARKALPEPRP